MGVSTNWIKSLMGLKKNNDQGKGSGKIKKWKFWRSSSSILSLTTTTSGGQKQIFQSAVSDSFSCVLEHGHGRSVAVVSTKNVVMNIEEWAAIKIQTTFRAFLAKRALRALKAIVRIQALFRGRLVRKKAALTLKCMESLGRAQARVRAQCNHSSQESKSLSEKQRQIDPTKRAEVGWCNSPGSAEQVKSKLQLRQEAALKRERAASYALAQQKQLTMKPSLYCKTSKACSLNDRHKSNSEEMHWLEKWMATKKYWENKYNKPNMTSPISERYQHNYTPVRYSSSSYEHGTAKLTRNRNISTKLSSSSAPSLDLFHDESTASNSSSISTSETPGSNNTLSEGYGNNKPSYMTATTSQKAKQRASPSRSFNNMQQRSFDNASFYNKSNPLSESIHRRSADLYPPVLLDKRNRFRSKQH